MNRSTLVKSASVLALALAVGACDEGLTDINDNPNAPTTVEPVYLLPNAINTSVRRALGEDFNMDLAALWVQHFAKIQYPDEDRYLVNDGTINVHWDGFYSGPLADLQKIIQLGQEMEDPNVEAVGLIQKSWTYSVMTDMWGDLPYSEAVTGDRDEGTLTPAYDPQQAIYSGIFTDLTAASQMIQPSANPFGAADVLNDGDMAQWQRFSNSLRLRLGMRLSEVDATRARSEVMAALAAPGGVISSNAQSIVMEYTSTAPDQNPIFVNQQTRDDHAISATIVDRLKALNDPRLSVYADPAANGGYRGKVNGVEEEELTLFSRIGERFTAADAPAVLIGYAEVLFLRAEAAARGWVAGDAASLYREAITASLQQYDVPAAEIAAYLAQPSVAYNGLDSIYLQKWIALFGNGPEAYSEWRRTGVPALQAGPLAENDGQIPLRLTYPTNEQTFNNDALQAAISRQGDALNDNVWWDAR